MKLHHTRFRRITAAAALLPLLSGLLLARGYWDGDTAVHVAAGEIENSTLAVGTHLIHLSALTGEIYEIARMSAEESGQFGLYYKSELGGGAWFDISAASSLEDITSGGTPVGGDVIEALFFTHHTRSDGITYDLRTRQAVSLFDIRSPYDLESLDELAPLKMQYDLTLQAGGESSVSRRIDRIWQTDVSRPPDSESALKTAGEYDKILADLQRYLDVLADGDDCRTEMQAVSGVMEAVDAGRRCLVFSNLEPALDAYLAELAAQGGGDGEEPAAPAELISAAAESLENVRSALVTYSGAMLDEGATVAGAVEYALSNGLIRDAAASDHAACDTDAGRLIALDNLLRDVIANRGLELALLEETLLPAATDAYTRALWAGESGEYRAEVEKKASRAVLNRIASENAGEADTRRGELEFFIEAACSRLDPQSAAELITERLAMTAETFSAGIPQDAFAEGAGESVEAHIRFLTGKQRALELARGGNEMDVLSGEKAELQTERLSALDRGDLAQAAALEEALEALEGRMRGLEAESSARLAQLRSRIGELQGQLADTPGDQALAGRLSAAQTELAALENGLSDGTLGAMAARMKQEALSAIRGEGLPGAGGGSAGGGAAAPEGGSAGGEAAAAERAVSALTALLPADAALVLPALQEIHDALILSGNGESLLEPIERAILENPGALRKNPDADALGELAEGYGGAEAAAALQLYYEETGNRAALGLIGALAQRQLALGSPLIYQRIDDSAGRYLPLTALQALTGRRYIWNKNASLGVLARGGDYYGFTVYSSRVLRDRDGLKTEDMGRMAKYLAGVHIPEEYAWETFGIQAVYLAGTSCGCACGSAEMARARELLELLLSL